jgi:hypothetical protein
MAAYPQRGLNFLEAVKALRNRVCGEAGYHLGERKSLLWQRVGAKV